jgi:hypothetical protein
VSLPPHLVHTLCTPSSTCDGIAHGPVRARDLKAQCGLAGDDESDGGVLERDGGDDQGVEEFVVAEDSR